MGFLDFLKGKEQPAPITFPATLGAPARGAYVPMKQIPDEMFSQGIMGVCCGVAPEEGKVFAPIDAKITQLMEILLHVGVDTVEMGGDGFTNTVKEGQMVQKGELLLTMDLDKIRAAGHPDTVIMAVTNTDDFAGVDEIASGSVQAGDGVLRVNK